AEPPGVFWRPDPAVDGYLEHHVLRGVPALPGAFVTELAAGAVTVREGMPTAFHGLRFHAPITAPPGRVPTYRVVPAARDEGSVDVRVLSDVRAQDGRILRQNWLHAQVTVRLTPLPDAPPRHDGPARNGQPTAAILY